MNFVNEYYNFKQTWYLKIGNLLLDCYICKEVNPSVEKIKYLYLEEVIKSYVNHERIDDNELSHKLHSIDAKALSHIECELLKYVVYVSQNFKYVDFTQTDYIYYTVLLEVIIAMYNNSFMDLNKEVVMNILKENLFRFPFIDFKRNQTKINLLLRYIKYIYKNNSEYFSNLKNPNIEINVTTLANHHKYCVVEIKNKLDKLLKFDSELIDSVNKNNRYGNKLFMLNFDLLVQQIVYMLEKNRLSVEKVIFNLDKYQFTRSAINYLNYYDCIISEYIMFSSKNKRLLDVINNKYDKCLYLNEDSNMKDCNDITLLVKNSYWSTHKKNSKKLEGLKFITISDNIGYKFDKEEY